MSDRITTADLVGRDLDDLAPAVRAKFISDIAAMAARARAGRLARTANTLGGRLRAWIDREGVTVGAIAAAIGCTPGHAHHLLTGRKKPSYDVLHAIARFMWQRTGSLTTTDQQSCDAIFAIHHTLFGEA